MTLVEEAPQHTKIGLTEHLADLVLGTALGPIGPDLLDKAERAFVDTVGVALGGTAEPSVETWWKAMGHRLPDGPARTFLKGVSTQPIQAALFNGLAAHALDFDDVSEPVWGHTSTVLVPALLAVGDEVNASGKDVLEALIVGYEVFDVLARAVDGPTHYARGWHATATFGTVAAAAAVSRVMGLNADRTRHALGIAASESSGSRQNFGTMTKPFHAGMAAANGVQAATLAAAGFTSDPSQLESPLGWVALMSAPNAAPDTSARATAWTLESTNLSVKQYACCYGTHRSLDATLDLRAEMESFDIAEVESVEVEVQPKALGPLIYTRPTTGLAGKFSMEYVVSAALLDGRIGLSTFTDESVLRDDVQKLLPLVHPVETATPSVGPAATTNSYAVVTVVTKDGQRHSKRVDVPRGEASVPLTDEQLATKFHDCLSFGGAADGTSLYDALRNLRSAASVRDVTRLFEH